MNDLACEACGAGNPPNSLYCIECGTSISQSKKSVEKLEVSDPDGSVELRSINYDMIGPSYDYDTVQSTEKLIRAMGQAEIERRNLLNNLKAESKEIENAVAAQKMGFDVELSSKGELEILNPSTKARTIDDLLRREYPHLYPPVEKYKKGGYRALRESADDDRCGICGTVKCLKHSIIPPIQEQYQEAFENIQKFRRERAQREFWNNQPFPMYEMRNGFSRGKGKSSGLNRQVPMRTMRKGFDGGSKKPRSIIDIGVDTTVRVDGKEFQHFVTQNSRHALITTSGPNTGVIYKFNHGIPTRINPRDLEYFEYKAKKNANWTIETQEIPKELQYLEKRAEVRRRISPITGLDVRKGLKIKIPTSDIDVEVIKQEMAAFREDPNYIPMISIPKENFPVFVPDSPRILKKGSSPITRRDVHKGIGRRKPPKKIDPIKDHVISKRKPKIEDVKEDLMTKGYLKGDVFISILAVFTLLLIIGISS